MPKDWGLDLNPTKSEHLPTGNSPYFVTCTLPSNNPPNTQIIPTFSTTKDRGIVLNTRPSVEDNVVSVANKARGTLLHIKRSFSTLTPSIFLTLYKVFICPHPENTVQASSPILSRYFQALESVQKRALKFVKGLRHIPNETALQWRRLISVVRRRIRVDLICMYKMMHDLVDSPCDAVFVAPTRIGLRGHAFKIHQQRFKTRRR